MNDKPILQALKKRIPKRVPFWLMRQAGRYLPEYRELRAKAGGFLDMVYHPERASEVTLQPIRRFGMDGAILFSDILVVPQAMGLELTFTAGEGPKLNPVRAETDLKILSLEGLDDTLSPVYDTVEKVQEKLKTEGFSETALIGFAGSPWTVACYMVEGSGSPAFARAKQWAAGEPDSFQVLIDLVTQATIHYLMRQIEAGVEAVQLFDSWAGLLEDALFQQWVIEPTRQIVAALKAAHPHIPVIGFPRQAGQLTETYVQRTGVDAIGIDDSVDLVWARDHLQPIACVQGNLKPELLLAGGDEMERVVHDILGTLSGGPFVFNLGHGVIKETPPEHVARLAEMVKEYKI